MKNECNLVKDLIPNYLENLLSSDSKEFIEHHISSCNSCKNLLNSLRIQKSRENDKDIESDKIELNHLKKVNHKIFFLKLILVIILALIILFCIIIAIKYNYITSITNACTSQSQYLKNLDNYNVNITEHHIDYENDIEYNFSNYYYYNKGQFKNISISKSNKQSIQNPIQISYGNVDSNEITTIYPDTKTITNDSNDPTLSVKNYYISKAFMILSDLTNNPSNLKHLILSFMTNINCTQFSGKDCYVFRFGNNNNYREIWINKENHLPIKAIYSIQDIQYTEINISFNLNTVTNDELIIPSLEEYIIKDKEI